jgi:hypothetical protein
VSPLAPAVYTVDILDPDPSLAVFAADILALPTLGVNKYMGFKFAAMLIKFSY